MTITLSGVVYGQEAGSGSGDGVDPESVRMYRSPEERREAGLGTELTDWLRFSGLIELEKERGRDYYSNAITVTEDERAAQDLQLAFVVEAFDWLEAEVIVEGEHQRRYRSQTDEAYVGVDLDGKGIKIGKQYLPFGEYFSHFVIGPMLEFGEIRQRSVIIDWSPTKKMELSAFAFSGDVDTPGESDAHNWGMALEWLSRDESLRFGLSYLSDLAETDEPLLGADTVAVETEVSAWNSYLLWGINERVEVTAEIVRANHRFRELDPGVNRPMAANLELAWLVHGSVQVAGRIEHSERLEDEPEWKYGLSIAWRPFRRVGVSADYLYSNYKDKQVFDDDDNEARRGHQFGVLVAFEF